jgi:hypothetical protein
MTDNSVPSQEEKNKTLAAKVFLNFVQKNLSTILGYLVYKNLLHPNEMSNPEVVWNKVIENWSELEENIGVVVELDQQFILAAQDAIKTNRLEVAVVLLAIAVEHRVNIFYRAILEAQGTLTNKEITEAIKATNIRDKIGWFLTLVSGYEVYDEMRNRILDLFELRNQIVHYKALGSENLTDNSQGSYNAIRLKINSLVIDDLINIPEDLSSVLNDALESLYKETKDFDLIASTSESICNWLNNNDSNFAT